MEDSDKHWLAGLLEGEGSFYAINGRTPCISIQMTDEDVVRRVARLFGGRAVMGRAGQREHHKPSWTTRVRGNPAADLMRMLQPLMGQRRRQQIDAALDGFTATRRGDGTKHGLHRYKCGCRCEVCRRARHDDYVRRRDAA
jgi:hypothetical protein